MFEFIGWWMYPILLDFNWVFRISKLSVNFSLICQGVTFVAKLISMLMVQVTLVKIDRYADIGCTRPEMDTTSGSGCPENLKIPYFKFFS